MDITELDKLITLHDRSNSIELPLKNLLRLSLVHVNNIYKEWSKETGKTDLQEFNQYLKIGVGWICSKRH